MNQVAVWNGGPKLETFEIRAGRNVYTLIRHVLRGGFASVLPTRYILLSRVLTDLNKAGIAMLVDDEAVVKKLPLTWRSGSFDILGPIVFVNNPSGSTFSGLTEKQMEMLRNHFERLPIAS